MARVVYFMSEAFTVVQTPRWQRMIIVIVYIVLTVALFWGVAWLVTSGECHADGGCNKIDQVIYAVMGVFDFIFAFIWGVMGMKGLLPGAKRQLVVIE